MNAQILLAVVAWGWVHAAAAQVPENLVVDGLPAIPPELRAQAAPYLEFRSAAFNSWHPTRRELLITTRFADTQQLHLVRMALGERRQLTFQSEPVDGGSFQPAGGDFIVFAQDAGGGEFYQLNRLDVASGAITLLTDGKSRNSAPLWAHDGKRFAYTSTRRNGRDTDVYLMDPSDPKSDRRLVELTGGGWVVVDWLPDDSRILLAECVSSNESYLWMLDARTGGKERVTPDSAEKISCCSSSPTTTARSMSSTAFWMLRTAGSKFARNHNRQNLDHLRCPNRSTKSGRTPGPQESSLCMSCVIPE